MVISSFVNLFIVLEEIATKRTFKAYSISSYFQLNPEPFLVFAISWTFTDHYDNRLLTNKAFFLQKLCLTFPSQNKVKGRQRNKAHPFWFYYIHNQHILPLNKTPAGDSSFQTFLIVLTKVTLTFIEICGCSSTAAAQTLRGVEGGRLEPGRRPSRTRAGLWG